MARERFVGEGPPDEVWQIVHRARYRLSRTPPSMRPGLLTPAHVACLFTPIELTELARLGHWPLSGDLLDHLEGPPSP